MYVPLREVWYGNNTMMLVPNLKHIKIAVVDKTGVITLD